ncbi:MAG: sulfatase-like hydrolase/transferase [Myxococcota bacterium]|nr:sulfatase-like hydrolase/transferase [Myxococcota bacterium]
MPLAVTGVAAVAAPPPLPPDRPNIVFIITDDQRWDTMWAMPLTLERIAQGGVSFSEAIVTSPICGPARASIQSGGYLAQNTGVLANNLTESAWEAFHDYDTLPLLLQREGYVTAMVGKYMNGLPGSHVPRGWDRWANGNGRTLSVGTSGEAPGVAIKETWADYGTDGIRDAALQFLAQNLPGPDPVFLYVAFVNPHRPATPAPEDEALFPDYTYRGRAHVPGFVYGWFETVEEQDEFIRDQLRSLQSVDRAVAAVHDLIESAGELENTVFVYTSDNGFLWGEHGGFAKKESYDESIRVPLIVKVPGIPERTDDSLVTMNLDAVATVLDLAGVAPPGDGDSLWPLLVDAGHPWRQDYFIEHWNRRWAGVRRRDAQGDYKYVTSWQGTRLFDLAADPFESHNLAGNPSFASVETELEASTRSQMGLGPLWFSPSAPWAAFGKAYDFAPGAVGGTGPYEWQWEPSLPPPLGILGLPNGHLSGVLWEYPTSPVLLRYTVRSQDERRQKPGRQEYTADLSLSANPNRDFDQDGVLDPADNCVASPNPHQLDADGNGRGDACDVGACGIGFEVGLLLPWIARRRRLRGEVARLGRERVAELLD